ncbi:MAG: transcriptional repressor [Bacteroidetes bacterium]|nr:transcriptional repressor [Bacteroidota bacterium]
MLRGTGLRYTRQRGEVLHLFRQHDTALTQADLEKMLPAPFDRITLYRILRSFEASGLLHKVLDDSGTTRFALCGIGCSEHEHHDEHVHFRCTNCSKTLCLPEISIPAVKLPQGYVFGEAKLLIEGICPECLAGHN